MEKYNSQIFEIGNRVLCYDSSKSILLCKFADNNKNKWIKKLNDINIIENIIEDPEKYYISCESYDTKGFYLALNKEDGSTEWFIPGKALFQIIFGGYLYLIFVDEDMKYYLLKVERKDGNKIWYYEINEDLVEYNFRNDRILLKYISGEEEKISPRTGTKIK